MGDVENTPICADASFERLSRGDPVQTRAWNGQSFSFSLHIHNRADLIQRSDDYLLTLGLDKPNNDGILPDSCAKENIS